MRIIYIAFVSKQYIIYLFSLHYLNIVLYENNSNYGDQ